ncbi:hypothetical protein Salat_2623000 [Sesamum alatum]|uniref:Uncharacterized protein n=1 Tax=Sesamum alatum TaxID=300844 RepID=A0AAE2CAM0_9LAMI|nr:hypothetical protein Salat_2623000 [Sesamum alatum]
MQKGSGLSLGRERESDPLSIVPTTIEGQVAQQGIQLLEVQVDKEQMGEAQVNVAHRANVHPFGPSPVIPDEAQKVLNPGKALRLKYGRDRIRLTCKVIGPVCF